MSNKYTYHFIAFFSLTIGLSFSLYGQNVLYTQTFGSCTMPTDWTTSVEYGGANWRVEDNIRVDPDYGDQCFLNFPDFKTPGKGDSSNIWAYSPWIQPINFDSLYIDFLLLYFKTNGKPQVLDIYYDQGNSRHLFASFDSTFWGATFNDYGSLTMRIDNSAQEPVRVVINYNNHGEQNASISLDNFVFRGIENSVCESAIELNLDDQYCLQGNNNGLHSEVVMDACGGVQTVRPIWYKLISPKTTVVKLSTQATFNDVVDVYYGRCDDLIPFKCSDKDEYGFTGEEMYIKLTEGVSYYFRISAFDSPFAPYPQGSYCIDLQEVPEIPMADNYDFCSGALKVTLDGECVEANTYNSQTTDPIPSLNSKSRSDVWFSYLHESTELVTIRTNSDFADVITIFSGNCFGLQEVNGTDQGPELVGLELKPDLLYYIKVSGYFSTIEGDLCLSIETAGSKPNNDDCLNAQVLTINDVSCLPASTVFARPSGIKSSCQIKASPDLWYSFISPGSGDISINVNAEFIYDIALYKGNCDSLVEQYCAFNPHRCEGYIVYENLEPNTVYFLQIAAHENAFGAVRGEVCMSVYETQNAPAFTPFNLTTKLECLFNGIGVLSLSTTGGVGSLSQTGNKDGDWILPGESYFVIVEDESGCRQIADGISSCLSDDARCDSSNLQLVVSVECELDTLGLQTGRSVVNYSYSGGIGSLQSIGNLDGDIVDNGDLIQIAVMDETGCVKMYRERATCEKFTCDQSSLALDVDYTCIDSLLRARLNVSAQDGNGQYSFFGDLNGTLLENGKTYLSIVSDEAGCSDTLSGVVACTFDSCAFSGLDVEVAYECIKDVNGNQTGQAILVVNVEGGIGQLSYFGGQSGDTLYNGESFDISVVDEWGCSSSVNGIIECIPTSINEHTLFGLKAYPIPASAQLIVAYEAIESGLTLFELLDVSGRIAWQYETEIGIGYNKTKLVLGDLASGIYHLRVKDSARTGILKVVIQK